MQDLDLVKWAIEVSSFALVAWMLMLTFTKTLPNLTEQFRADLRLERETSVQGMREVMDALQRLSIILLYHDATVRGTNPQTLGSTEELLRRLQGISSRPSSNS